MEKSQQKFLQDAMQELGLTREQFAKRIGAPWETFRKWCLKDSGQSREMPAIAHAAVVEVLEHERLKREHEKALLQLKKARADVRKGKAQKEGA